MSKFEQRTIPAESLEVRSEEKGSKISGYGILYGRETLIWEDLYEIIHPGAASKILESNPDIRSAFNHDRNHILGRTKSGTLKLQEFKGGVRYTVDPPEAQWAKDLMQSIERRDIDGSSFTFAVDPQNEKVTKRDDGSYLREIFEFKAIGEVGPVSYPAYEGTSANVRSAKDIYDSYTADLRAQEEAAEIAERQRALSLRKKHLDLLEKEI